MHDSKFMRSPDIVHEMKVELVIDSQYRNR